MSTQGASTLTTIADEWLGGTGNWSDPTKWSNGVPAADSAVTIGNTDAGDVTLDIDDSIDSLTIANGYALNFAGSKALTISNAMTVQAGGSLSLTTGDTLEVSGSASDAGSMTIGAGATFDALSGALAVSGTLTVAGTVNGSGGTAVQMASGMDRLVLDPGFAFNANVIGGGRSTLELAAGTEAGELKLGTEFTNFAPCGSTTTRLGLSMRPLPPFRA